MIIISRNPDIVAASNQVALVKVKSDAIATINEAVGRVRLTYLTDIPGQQAIYTEKATEAVAYVAMDPAPSTLTDFPFMAAEIMITAPDPWQLAQVWLNMQAQLRLVGSQSEQLRLGTQLAINDAATLNEVRKIMVIFENKIDRS